jgi:hypothetical protein
MYSISESRAEKQNRTIQNRRTTRVEAEQYGTKYRKIQR